MDVVKAGAIAMGSLFAVAAVGVAIRFWLRHSRQRAASGELGRAWKMPAPRSSEHDPTFYDALAPRDD